MQKVYADALMRLQGSAKEAELTENLIAHLKREGRMKLLPGILAELKRRDVRSRALAPVLEVAHESDKAAAQAALKAEGVAAAHVRVNHSLLQGWRLKSANTLIDQSGKRALIDLYRKITK